MALFSISIGNPVAFSIPQRYSALKSSISELGLVRLEKEKETILPGEHPLYTTFVEGGSNVPSGMPATEMEMNPVSGQFAWSLASLAAPSSFDHRPSHYSQLVASEELVICRSRVERSNGLLIVQKRSPRFRLPSL
jgi:hypothetical protein